MKKQLTPGKLYRAKNDSSQTVYFFATVSGLLIETTEYRYDENQEDYGMMTKYVDNSGKVIRLYKMVEIEAMPVTGTPY